MEINGKKGGETKTKEWGGGEEVGGAVAWVLSEYVMTMSATGEPLARCGLLGKQCRDRGRVGIASSWCHLVRESKVSTSGE